jgi:hypothetical protein
LKKFQVAANLVDSRMEKLERVVKAMCQRSYSGVFRLPTIESIFLSFLVPEKIVSSLDKICKIWQIIFFLDWDFREKSFQFHRRQAEMS